MYAYRLMTAWNANEHFDFEFYNAHDINYARDSSLTDSIKQQLRERMANSKQFVLLVGDKTKYLRNFVPWEIELARKKDLPIIVINLNGKRTYDDNLCPSAIKTNVYTMNVSFQPKIIKYALDHFAETYQSLKADMADHTYGYKESVYTSLGL